MKLASSEVEAEADRWGAGEEEDTANEEGASVDERGNVAKAHEDNDIVRRAKNMSGMALSMYEFTKGDGGSSLRTTQDLFTQAEYLAEEANRLYKLVRQFSYQVWLRYCDTYHCDVSMIFAVRVYQQGRLLSKVLYF